MDFGFFQDISNSSKMSGLDVSDLLTTDGVAPSTPDSMLSLDEQLLSSFEDVKPLSPTTNSSECFYFLQNMNTTCGFVDAAKDNSNGTGIDKKLFLRNEKNGVWVLADKEVKEEEIEDISPVNIPTVKTKNHSTAIPGKTKLTDIKIIASEVQYNTNQVSQASLSPDVAQNFSPKILTVSGKSFITIKPRNATPRVDQLREKFQVPKSSTKRAENKKITRKYAKCKIKPVAEKFLRTLAESVTQQVTDTVRKELQNGVDTLKNYLDERLHLSKPFQSHENHSNDDDSGSEKPQRSMSVHCDLSYKQNHKADTELPHVKKDTKFTNDKMDCDVTKNGVRHTSLLPKEALNHASLLQGSDAYETDQKQGSAADTLLKYVTSATLVESLKTSTEQRDNGEDNLNPADVLNMSISSLESNSNNTFEYPKFSLVDMVKDESSSDAEQGTFHTDSYLELFAAKNTHFLELSEQREEKFKPLSVGNEARTTTMQTLTSMTVSKGPKKRCNSEELTKTDSEIRKSKKHLICEVCDRFFLNNSSLKQHMSFHRPQRPYQCDHDGCIKSYKTRSELNRHLIVHTGQKNYECQKCGKAFLRKQYLKTHLIRHNEGLTWQCSLCAKIFVCEEDLNKHKISYHRNGKRALQLITEEPNNPEIIYIDDSLEA